MSSKTNATTLGSCLCGKIRFEIVGTPADFNNCLCFCDSCRKITGSIGMANSWCKKDKLKFLTDIKDLHIYIDTFCDSGGTIHRGFCATCGSTMLSENREKFPGDWIVPSGALEIDPVNGGWKPGTEFFCKRKAEWFQTVGETKAFEEQF